MANPTSYRQSIPDSHTTSSERSSRMTNESADITPFSALDRLIENESNFSITTPVQMSKHRSRTETEDDPSLLRSGNQLISQSPPSPTEPANRASVMSYKRYSSESHEIASLPNHVYHRGLLEGRHSDITVIAFGQKYDLHRMILDRAPFFATALSEPWAESNSRELPLYPQDVDPNITQDAFVQALRYLYGRNARTETQEEAHALFATACWLELQDLIASSTRAILQMMNPTQLASTIRLVTTNYYGKPGQVILTAATSMLCGDGWEMPIKYWNDIPAEIVREVAGSDGFFVDGEWSRWMIAKRLLNRRLKRKAKEAGISWSRLSGQLEPSRLNELINFRNSAKLRRNYINGDRELSEPDITWFSIYADPEIEPLLSLLETGIHYIHLSYEQLQIIRKCRDCYGLPLVNDRIVMDALWAAMELRQVVVTADEHEAELGLSKSFPEKQNDNIENLSAGLKQFGKGKAIARSHSSNSDDGGTELAGSDRTKPRKFWIPNVDSNTYLGQENMLSTASQWSSSHAASNHNASEAQLLNEFTSSNAHFSTRSTTNMGRSSTMSSAAAKSASKAYTHFPPFRFAVEFSNPRLLQENKRAYSRTVFYAGSFWRIYIQRKRSTKGVQLGVYLHRAKEHEAESGTVDPFLKEIGDSLRTVDERIGMLERGMLLRSEQSRSTNLGGLNYSLGQTNNASGHQASSPSSNGANNRNSTSFGLGSGSSRHNPGRASLSSRYGIPDCSSPEADRADDVDDLKPGNNFRYSSDDTDDPDDERDTDNDDDYGPEDHPYSLESPSRPSRTNTGSHGQSHRRHRSRTRLRHQQHQQQSTHEPKTPTLPRYIDTRPTIRTYFKIYNPSKGGRVLSVYQSAPDSFNFSQSWGWKSNSMLDDDGGGSSGNVIDSAMLGGGSSSNSGADRDRERKRGEQQQQQQQQDVLGGIAGLAESVAGFGGGGNRIFGDEVDDGISGIIRTVGSVGGAWRGSGGGGGEGSERSGIGNGDRDGDGDGQVRKRAWKRRQDVLRFMVVIGNV